MIEVKSIVFINSHPIQYIVPLYQKIGNRLQFRVWYCDDASISGKIDRGFGVPVKWDSPILEGYDFEFFKNSANLAAGKVIPFLSIWNPALIRRLMIIPPSIIVVNGWQFLTFLIAVFVGKKFGHKIVYRLETPWRNEQRKTGSLQIFKRLILRFIIFPKVDYFMYIGAQNREFYTKLGVSDHQLIFTPYSVDNEFFCRQYDLLSHKRAKLREQFGIPSDAVVLLMCGKYQAVKRPLDLLEANSRLDHNKVFIVFVGEGVLRPKMEEYIAKRNFKNVLLTGFVNQSEISKYYAVADVLVMPSESETWGLSINEAFNFQLPVVASDTVGSGDDLIRNYQNGLIFKKGNVDELVAALNYFINDSDLRRRAGAISQEVVRDYSYEVCIENMRVWLEGV